MLRIFVPINAEGLTLYDADILSYRHGPLPRNPLKWPGWALSKEIGVVGRGEECHTGVVWKDNGDTVALGMRLARQKLKTMHDEVTANPGLIDVYRYKGCTTFTGSFVCDMQPALSADRRQAIARDLRRFALHDDYGTLNVLLAGLWFVPGLRWIQPHYHAVQSMKRPPYCSQAVSFGYRNAGAALLQNRADRHMLPTDVITSPLLQYICTLLPPVEMPVHAHAYFERQIREDQAARLLKMEPVQ